MTEFMHALMHVLVMSEAMQWIRSIHLCQQPEQWDGITSVRNYDDIQI